MMLINGIYVRKIGHEYRVVYMNIIAGVDDIDSMTFLTRTGANKCYNKLTQLMDMMRNSDEYKRYLLDQRNRVIDDELSERQDEENKLNSSLPKRTPRKYM